VIDEEPKRGVNEARFVLTLLTCLLVAIGYIVLLRYGGVRNTAFEPSADDPSAQAGASPAMPKDTELMPHVLPVEPADDPVQRMTQRMPESTPRHQLNNPDLR
jgi:hypothetical protein